MSSKGVSAEFGGYRVGAGLGGGDTGGGLFAKAEAPHANAGAGAYGGAAASAGGGANANADVSGFGGFDGNNKPGQNGGFFDRIFNVSIWTIFFDLFELIIKYYKLSWSQKGKNRKLFCQYWH